MKSNLRKTGRIFYCVAIIGVGIHQLFYADFCPFFFPQWPNPIPGYHILAEIFNLTIIVAGGAILFARRARNVSLVLGGLLLLLLLLGQIPFEFIVIPYKKYHLGLWILPLKELALAGGAFCIAGSIPATGSNDHQTSGPMRVLEKLIPFGRCFFSTTMILFGVSHFLYPGTVSAMVPEWIPGHSFWTYFAGTALIAGGIGILINNFTMPAALLMGIMILIWFVILHIPDAFAHPLDQKGNEITAAFSALAFSGIAFVIAGTASKRLV